MTPDSEFLHVTTTHILNCHLIYTKYTAYYNSALNNFCTNGLFLPQSIYDITEIFRMLGCLSC